MVEDRKPRPEGRGAVTVSTETLQWATLEAEIREQEDEAIQRGADFRDIKKSRGLRRYAAGLSRKDCRDGLDEARLLKSVLVR